jgi:hypothetical protein
MFISIGAFASDDKRDFNIQDEQTLKFVSNELKAIKGLSKAKIEINNEEDGGCTVKIHCEFTIRVNVPGYASFNLLIKNDISFVADNCIEAGKAAGAFAAQLIKELA